MKKVLWIILGLAQAAGMHAITWFVRMPVSQASAIEDRETVSRIVSESLSNGGVGGSECGSTCEKQCRKNCAP